jgi:hypothetical protein
MVKYRGYNLAGTTGLEPANNGHITLEVECLDRLYLNGYIGPLATSGGLVNFMREQLGKPIPSPAVLGKVTDHKERKDEIANEYRRKLGVRDGIVCIGVAQEKAQTFQGRKVDGSFDVNKGLSNLPYLQKIGREINRRLLEVERVAITAA